MAAVDAGDLTTGERILLTLVEQDPAAHDAWLALAVIAMRTGSPDIAVERARRAVELDRSNPLYLNNLGIAHAELGQLALAERAFRRALKVKPAYPGAHYNLAKALHKQGRLAESLREYERAHALEPGSLAMQLGLCRIYRLHGEPARALAVLRAATGNGTPRTELVPAFAGCIADVDGADAAVAWLRELISRQPDNQVARYSLADLLLSLGHWRDAWQHYLWRTHEAPQRARPQAALPTRLDGKRIVLRAEQGIGDVLFFLRFAGALRERGAAIALECPPKLTPLLADRIAIDEGAAFDLQIWLGDLPAQLETEATPAAFALRASESDNVLARLGPPPYLGLTWRAGTNMLRAREYGNDLPLLFKEVPAALLGQAVRGWPGTLVSLQRAPAREELDAIRAAAAAPIHDLSKANEDLREVLAVLAQLDEYVAVSNTNIHLLAGLGRTARVLVPYPPEWRWGREGESPWFPGFPLYRQSPSRDWSGALQRLRADLSTSAGSRPRAPA